MTTAGQASSSGGVEPRRVDRIAAALRAVVVIAFAVVVARVVQLQVWPPEALAAHLGPRVSTITEPGRRGDVLDRHGRVLAATRFGWRCFVDPKAMRLPADADLLLLADALGMRVEEVAPRVLSRMVENQRRAAARENTDPDDDRPDVRYLPIGGSIDDARAERVRSLRIPGVHLETWPVREVVAGDSVRALVGKVGFEEDGLLGAERVLEKRLEPVDGRLRYVRDARGRALWVDPGGYEAPQRGEDVRLTIDLQIQRIAAEELQRGVEEADAAGGRCVIVDPMSGDILAMVDIVRPLKDAVTYDFKTVIPKDNAQHGVRYRTIVVNAGTWEHPELARNRCVEDVYEPGSTFKPFMWSAVTERGLADPGEVIDTEGGRWSTAYGRSIADVVRKDRQTWTEALVNSSNIAMVKVTTRLSAEQMHSAVVKFGFGSPVALGFPGEASGIVTPLKRWSKYTHTSVATGYEVAVTPVQMARAFSVFARTGESAGTLPTLRVMGAGEAGVTRRVLPQAVAELCRNTMRGVTANLDRKLAARTPAEKGWRYELFGKSGTAEIPLTRPPAGMKRPKGSDGYFSGQYNSSFIAGGPAESPRLVCLVVIDDPGPELVRERRHYGAGVAGPVVRRAMERALQYLGTPASPPPSQPVAAHPE